MTTTLLSTHIQNYLTYCKNQKRLDEKTLKAYRIDLAQFAHAQIPSDITDITPDLLEEYVASLHEQYKPRTVKRKNCIKRYCRTGTTLCNGYSNLRALLSSQ